MRPTPITAWVVLSLVLGGSPLAYAQDAAEDEQAQQPQSADEARIDRDDERARTHFEAGLSYYQEGAYDRARDEFTRAWELSHRTPLLLNLATVEERLGHQRVAAGHIRQYLELEPEDPQRERLERRIANLERLAAESEAEQAANAESGAAATVQTSVSATPAERHPDEGMLIGGITLLGVGGAAAIMTAVFGGLAVSATSDLENGCGATRSCSDDEIADAATFAIATDVSLGVSVLSLGVGALLVGLAHAAMGGDGDAVAAAPWIGPNAGGVAAGGSF